MSGPIYLPAPLAATPHWLPWCCTRHGEQAVIWKPATAYSRPPMWVYCTLLAGVLPALVIAVALRRKLELPAWPFCRRCLAVRRGRLVAAWLASAAWLALCGTAVAVLGLGSVWGDLGAIGGFAVTPFLLLALVHGAGWASLLRGSVTADGWHLIVSRPAAAFVSLLPPPPPPAAFAPPGVGHPHLPGR